MRTELIAAREAQTIIMRDAAPHGEELAPIAEAAWRVLARDLAARRTQPPFPASAMDGYAVRIEDLDRTPKRLKLRGAAAAGHPFSGRIGAGEAVRIFTGAAVPEGADSIVIQENARGAGDEVEILSRPEKGRFIRLPGLDFREGEILLRRNQTLNPFRVSLAGSMNYAEVPVYQKPLVALLATGDELVVPGASAEAGSIVASNTLGMAAMIRDAGGELADLGIAADTVRAIGDAAHRALEMRADLLVTTGGASVGDHDLVQPALEKLGALFEFSRVAIRPGKPMLYGNIKRNGHRTRIIGLAGNPVSSLIAARVYVHPLVAALAGRPRGEIAPQQAVLGRDLPANDEREEYMRASAEAGDRGEWVVTPFEQQDSSMLAALVRAQALVVRPAGAPAAARGDGCEAIILSKLFGA
jgi:molybdopterin molybdotransferase